MHKYKLILALIFQLRFDLIITDLLEKLFNTMIEYYEYQNIEPDMVFQA